MSQKVDDPKSYEATTTTSESPHYFKFLFN